MRSRVAVTARGSTVSHPTPPLRHAARSAFSDAAARYASARPSYGTATSATGSASSSAGPYSASAAKTARVVDQRETGTTGSANGRVSSRS
ncbi:MAG TPA: hypothetical protein VGD01_09260 [Candidatus Elarobacter sp.]